jgi:hypothetical protein
MRIYFLMYHDFAPNPFYILSHFSTQNQAQTSRCSSDLLFCVRKMTNDCAQKQAWKDVLMLDGRKGSKSFKVVFNMYRKIEARRRPE